MREVKDRAVTALVLGIISLVIPFIGLITGPIGWWCANDHIDSVDRGYLSRGRGMAVAGKACSMIATILYIAVLGFYAVLLILALAGSWAGT